MVFAMAMHKPDELAKLAKDGEPVEELPRWWESQGEESAD